MIAKQTRGLKPNDMKYLISKIVKQENDIEDIFKNLNYTDKNIDYTFVNPIVIRTGGIGDLIALSSLIQYLHVELNIPTKNLSFITQEKYKTIFDWFETPVNFISYFSPITDNYTSISKKKIVEKFKPIFFEGVIENSKDNWFELQFAHIGFTLFDPDYGKPKLVKKRINENISNIDSSKKSILINPQSTAIIRSMRFEDLYSPLVKTINDFDCNIYVHEKNLNELDFDFINNIKDNRIKIIKANSLEQFFLDSYDATLTISVDTSLLHFRQGISKPAIGIYGAFSSDCRTKYYDTTLSFDITSTCSYMPCYKHVKKAFETCDFQQQLHNSNIYDEKYKLYAPCTCNA